jgi:hypothetical protein
VYAWLCVAAHLNAFTIDIIPNVNYNVFCTLLPTAPRDGKYSEIFINTNPGPTYHALMFHSTPFNQLASLKTQVSSSSASTACQIVPIKLSNWPAPAPHFRAPSGEKSRLTPQFTTEH